MIEFGIALVGGVLYLTGQYGLALLLIVLAIVSGAGAALMAIANPDWYARKRIQSGLDVDFMNPSKGVASMLVTKALIVSGLAWAAWHVAQKAGYL